MLNKAVHKLNGSETSNDACSPSTSPKSSSHDFSAQAISVSQVQFIPLISAIFVSLSAILICHFQLILIIEVL